MAAPRSEIFVDQSERLVGTLNGKFEKALGLLLGRQVTYGLEVGVDGARGGGRHEDARLRGRGGQRRSAAEPIGPRNFNACDLIACDSGKGGQKNHQRNVTRKAIRDCRMETSGPLRARSGLRGPGDAYGRVVHGSCERYRFGARLMT